MKKEFTLRLDDAACAELENLKKLSGEKTDAKAIRFAIQNYATLNDRYIETQRQIRTWKDKYAALNKAVDDYLSSFEEYNQYFHRKKLILKTKKNDYG